MSRDTEQLRAEIESTRDRMSDTLDQLGERLNPNRIKQEVRHNIREATIGRVENMARHAADRVHETRDGLLNTIRDNPVPSAMIGIGLGWLLFSGRRSQSDLHTHDRLPDDLNGYAGTGYVGDISATSPRLRQDDAAGGMGASIAHEHETGVRERVSEVAHRAEQRLSDVTHSAKERVSEATHRAQEKVSDVGHRIQHVAADVRETTRLQAYRVEEGFQRTLQDNPLAIGAVALAVGLATGFAIPESRREARLMGPARDRLVDRAREAASDAKERVQEVAERVIDETASSNESTTRNTGGTTDTDRSLNV